MFQKLGEAEHTGSRALQLSAIIARAVRVCENSEVDKNQVAV